MCHHSGRDHSHIHPHLHEATWRLVISFTDRFIHYKKKFTAIEFNSVTLCVKKE